MFVPLIIFSSVIQKVIIHFFLSSNNIFKKEFKRNQCLDGSVHIIFGRLSKFLSGIQDVKNITRQKICIAFKI